MPVTPSLPSSRFTSLVSLLSPRTTRQEGLVHLPSLSPFQPLGPSVPLAFAKRRPGLGACCPGRSLCLLLFFLLLWKRVKVGVPHGLHHGEGGEKRLLQDYFDKYCAHYCQLFYSLFIEHTQATCCCPHLPPPWTFLTLSLTSFMSNACLESRQRAPVSRKTKKAILCGSKEGKERIGDT